MRQRSFIFAAVALALLLAAAATAVAKADREATIQLDFTDTELSVVINTIARLTGKNFIYDDRVRGRVTIVSPTPMTLDQAYAVFESVLQVKGFTTVQGPGGVLKVIPVREAKESSIETVRGRSASPNRDQFVTRLIPLRYIDAEAITNTVKPMVSKDAAMVAYPPTNTIILTDTAANIRRLLSILDAIDVETYKEELAVIKIHHADAATLGGQISEIYGAVASGGVSAAARRARTAAARRTAGRVDATAQAAERARVRIITDSRTNSLLVLASRGQLADIRELVRKLDVPVTGGGRIRVYYLKHADAEELAQTLNGLVSGAPSGTPGRTGGVPGATPQALRAMVTELSEGVNLTADPATNSLVIQSSKEAYETLRAVIDLLDIARPQVLVEALIMEVDVSDGFKFGINSLLELSKGWDIALASVTDSALQLDPLSVANAGSGALGAAAPITAAAPFAANVVRRSKNGNTVIQTILELSETDNRTNIISAPHILTSDNEEAEIRIGNNIPIITSRVDSAAGQVNNLASSVNVERQDIGVTLRVTPQISEGNMLRLKIFQEISGIAKGLADDVGNASDVGVALTNRRIDNTLVVADGETVVIGGLLSDDVNDDITKVPFLGDIPILGWLFKTKSQTVRKTNLLVFLTPHIVRNAEDLAAETIRKREDFEKHARVRVETSGEGDELPEAHDPVRSALLKLNRDYPLSRMLAIESGRAEARASTLANRSPEATHHYGIRAAVYRDADEAARTLQSLLDGGYDGRLVSEETQGVVSFGLELGPYDDLAEAERIADTLRESFGLQPSVLVLRTETR